MESIPQSRLRVLIVGAGIAGLATGLMLREFADVTILEAASELKEIGAGLTLGPGVSLILKKYGVHLENEGGVAVKEMAMWSAGGKLAVRAPLRAKEKTGEDVMSLHRADLHSALLRAATDTNGPGHPCIIHLGHKAVKLDTKNGVVETSQGVQYTGDTVVVADGIRSALRQFILGGDHIAKPSGESAYRYLLYPEDLRAVGHPFMDDGDIPPFLNRVEGHGKRIIAYVCRGGGVFNCVGILPDSELHETISDKWTAKGDKQALVKAFKDFDPLWTDIIKLAKDVGIWQFRDMNPLPEWVKGRAVAIGDAAHAMLPHMGGGSVSAIEDAEALAVFLRKTTSDLDAVHESLQRVHRVRFKRATKYQALSRKAGLNGDPNINMPAELLELWTYYGAERWVIDRPDMIL